MSQKAEIYKLIDECKKTGGADFWIRDLNFEESEDRGIGVFTNLKIERIGSILISVPFQICISVDLIANSTSLKSLFDANPGYLAYPDEVLAIGLIFAYLRIDKKIDDKIICPYLQHVRSLPRKINTPLFWTEEELNELKGSNVFHLTRLLKKQMESDFEALYKPLIATYPEYFESLTIDHYFWALSMVYSRSAEIVRFGQTVRCIPPVLDMANHDPNLSALPSDALSFDPSSDSLQLKSVRELQPHDECTAVYGNYPNSKLLYTYGFVVHGNPHKAIDLWTKVTPTVYKAEMKQQILHSHPLTAVQTYDFSGTIREGFVSAALLATIRVIQATEEELPNIYKAFLGQMVSLRNEKASYVSLKNLLIARLNPETAEVFYSHYDSEVLC